MAQDKVHGIIYQKIKGVDSKNRSQKGPLIKEIFCEQQASLYMLFISIHMHSSRYIIAEFR